MHTPVPMLVSCALHVHRTDWNKKQFLLQLWGCSHACKLHGFGETMVEMRCQPLKHQQQPGSNRLPLLRKTFSLKSPIVKLRGCFGLVRLKQPITRPKASMRNKGSLHKFAWSEGAMSTLVFQVARLRFFCSLVHTSGHAVAVPVALRLDSSRLPSYADCVAFGEACISSKEHEEGCR